MGVLFVNHKAKLVAQKQTMQELAEELSRLLEHPVVDMTGLAGEYDFTLYYTPEGNMTGASSGASMERDGAGQVGPIDSAEPAGDNLFSALPKQLGLQLQSKKGSMDILVIDHAAKIPTEN
jgi:uncharacterized protein (TIGR03435 family)